MTVSPEGPGRRELAQLVTYHILGDEDRDVPAPVVDRNGMPDHQRKYRGTPGPTLDDPLVAPGVHGFDFLKQLGVRVGPLLQRTRHQPFLLLHSSSSYNEPVRLLLAPGLGSVGRFTPLGHGRQ